MITKVSETQMNRLWTGFSRVENTIGSLFALKSRVSTVSALTAEGANINGDTFAGTMLGSTDAIAAASSVYFGTVGILTDLHHRLRHSTRLASRLGFFTLNQKILNFCFKRWNFWRFAVRLLSEDPYPGYSWWQLPFKRDILWYTIWFHAEYD